MTTVRDFVRHSFRDERLLTKKYEPHGFHSKWRNAPTEFEVIFLHDDSLFQYGFAYTAERIWEEWLFERPSATRKQRQIFTREYKPENDAYAWEMNSTHLKGERQSWKEQTRDNALFISTAIQLNAKSMSRPFHWLTSKFWVIPGVDSIGNYTEFHLNEGKEDHKTAVLAFLADTDMRLEDLETKERDIFEMSRFKSLLTKHQEAMKSLFPEDAKAIEVFTHRNDETEAKIRLNLDDESSGTRTLFALSGPILNSLENGHTLVVDELDVHLHPLALRHIVRMFSSPETNPNQAQLIFTTHDPTVTDEECIGRDQIWLVEKGDGLESCLTPFSNYKTRDARSFRRRYLQGRYGAVPRLAG